MRAVVALMLGLAVGGLAAPGFSKSADWLKTALAEKLAGKPTDFVDFYLCAFSGKDSACTQQMAEAYMHGDIGYVDQIAGINWYRRAAGFGRVDAMALYASWYCLSIDGRRAALDPGLIEAMAWELVAARREARPKGIPGSCFEADPAAGPLRPSYGIDAAAVETTAANVEQFLARIRRVQ